MPVNDYSIPRIYFYGKLVLNTLMILKTYAKKNILRFLIINVLYFLVRLTVDHSNNDTIIFSAMDLFHYFTAFFLLVITLETNDWLLRKETKHNDHKLLGVNNSLKIIVINLVGLIPIVASLYYIVIFKLNFLIENSEDNLWLLFRLNFFKATLLGLVVIVFNLFYWSFKQKKDLENSLNILEKEATISQYRFLKNQINPLFLYNSLHTLTTLMYKDRDLASDFVSRLAITYRYILNNKEENLIELEEELNFLNSYIFMININQGQILNINISVSVNPKEYLVPALIMQILIENVLKYSISSKEKPLEIYVASNEKKQLIIQSKISRDKCGEESKEEIFRDIIEKYSFYTCQKIMIEREKKNFKVIIPLLSKRNLRKN
ncbi:histidine kinase [Aquimarina sp. 2201CG5-10]|uniref:histidine kinase n=1 Tax=Aquimarina callyspongiae TaxID=3098150 RepID=UPI002AB4F90C|nr:histidine kinase [Aquimarina sp. 2201CG5-10]MDY8136603.1 histidine kinase [Aquimarina sp. 2201CG5-10]